MTLEDRMHKIGFAVQRRMDLLKCPDLALGRRLGSILSRHALSGRLIEEMVREEAGGLAVTLPAQGLTFRVETNGDPSEARAKKTSMSQVVAEAFVQPVLLSKRVRPKPGGVSFDVGANIGTTAAVISRMVGPSGRVFAFEPGVAPTLRRNLEANDLANVEVIEAAVGDREGTIELNVSVNGIDNSIAYALDCHTQHRTVPMITLDDFTEQRGIERVDYIKMDIEGAEELALRGAEKLIARCHPSWSISSYHQDMSNEPQHPKLVAFLKARGYKIEAIPGFHIYAHAD